MSQSKILSFNVSDHTVSFFVNGKLHTVQSDHFNFTIIRAALLSNALADIDSEQLISLTDLKEAIKEAAAQASTSGTANTLKFDHETDVITYGGKPLEGVWVDKIIAFANEGHQFDAIFRALNSLQSNPSGRARDRFPLFAERNQFGFLPDGRIGAFKIVRGNFFDIHSGTFDNSPGKFCEMPRQDVNDDPEQTCSYGLHLGALSYIRNGVMGSIQGSDRKVVFCAFWPQDVVSVPVDYNGEKMRVCKYEVLSEVDPKSVDEFLAARTTLIDDNVDEDEDGETHIRVTIAELYSVGYEEGWDAFNNDETFIAPVNPNAARGYRAGWSTAENNGAYSDQDPLNYDD